MVPRAVLMKTGLKTVNNAKPLNTVRSVNTARSFSTVRIAKLSFLDVTACASFVSELSANPTYNCAFSITDVALSLREGLLHDQHGGFTLSLLDSLFSNGLRTVKSIPSKCHLRFSQVLKGSLDKVIYKPGDISCWEESIINVIRSWGERGGSLQLVRETLAESSPPMLDVDEEDLDLSEQNLKQCRRKICDSHYTMVVRVLSSSGVALYNDVTLQELNAKHPFKIKSFPRGTSYGRDGLRAQHLMDCLSGVVVAISYELVTQVVNLFLDGKCPIMLGEYISSAPLTPLVKPVVFGIGVSGGGEAILHGRLYFMQSIVWLRIVGMMKFVYVVLLSHIGWKSVTLTQPDCTTRNTYYDHDKGCSRAWYLDDGTIVGDTLVIGKVLELIMEDGPHCGLHLNVDKTSELVMKRVSKTIGYMDAVVKINDHHGGADFFVLVQGISKLFTIGYAHMPFLRLGLQSNLIRHVGIGPPPLMMIVELVMKRVSKTIGYMDAVVKINDHQRELLLLRACMGISKLYFAMRTCPPCIFESTQRYFDVALCSALERDVLNYAFLVSRLQSIGLQTKLIRHVGIGPTFDDALCMFNTSMETGLLSNPSEIAAPKLMKKMADLYFTRVTKNAESTFSLSPRQMAGRITLRTGLGRFLFLACSRVFAGDIYRDHIVSCVGVIGIKHRHNVVRDTLVNIYFHLRISVGSSPLTQTGMANFVPGRVVIDDAQRKRVKYMAKCAAIRYVFLSFSFSSLGELEEDAVNLLKRIRKFSIVLDIEARVVERLVSIFALFGLVNSKFHANVARFHRTPLKINKASKDNGYEPKRKSNVNENGSSKAAKILANRLVGVLGDIVNEVQSAFISDRQILDGPFILNEVIQWCKSKKKQSLIFKVDFEKAYDSVRWDFLDDVAKWEVQHVPVLKLGRKLMKGEISLSNWKLKSLSIGGIEQSQFKELTDLLIPIVLNPCPDKRFQVFRVDRGVFSVASIRRFIDDQRLLTMDSKTLWIKSVPIKVNILAWKIKLEALPTRFNISRRGIEIDSILCPICDRGVESTEHIFFRYGDIGRVETGLDSDGVSVAIISVLGTGAILVQVVPYTHSHVNIKKVCTLGCKGTSRLDGIFVKRSPSGVTGAVVSTTTSSTLQYERVGFSAINARSSAT
ncbi:ankyrin repeat-containing protein ITN1-like protein [Tanacetum coccineum]